MKHFYTIPHKDFINVALDRGINIAYAKQITCEQDLEGWRNEDITIYYRSLSKYASTLDRLEINNNVKYVYCHVV